MNAPLPANLDTSGYVQCPAPDQKPNESTGCWFWSDLSPFVQGYVEALFERLRKGDLGYSPLSALKKELRFDRLAPETLARIMEDCADGADGARGGALFWKMRQEVKFGPNFPPLTPYLGDDGKVYLREAI